MTKYGRIYIIRNTVNDKVYVGQTTVSIKLRFQNHLSSARHGKDYVIGKAIRKYGEDKFYIELLEECLQEELNEREKYWISFFNSTNNKFGYNISIGGHVPFNPKDINKEEVLLLFNKGIPAYQIAKIMKVGVPKVTQILKENNINYGITLQKTSIIEEKEIIELYNKGLGTMDLSKKFNKNKSTIRRILLRNNVKLRTYEENKNARRNLLPSVKTDAPRELCNHLDND